MDDPAHRLIILAGILQAFGDSDEDENDIHEPVIWVKVTVNVDEYLMMQDAAFRLHFRMSTAIFESLVMVIGNVIEEDNIARHNEDFQLPHILLAVLWILATPDTFRSKALRFGVTPGVLHSHYINMVTVLSDLSAEVVLWPSAEERTILKEVGRRRTGFPGAVMAIDGSYIPLCYAPVVEPQRYVNRHHDYAVILQGCVDINLTFRDVYCGEPGSLHDSRVFRRSPLSTHLLEQQHLLAADEHIIGDSAYILTDKVNNKYLIIIIMIKRTLPLNLLYFSFAWVLTPFRNNGNLDAVQINYNYRLSSLRSMVERAFGRLKMKWRRLFFLSAKRMDLVIRTIMASITLHNFLINDGEIPEVNLQPIQPEENFGFDMEEDEQNLLDDLNFPNVEVEPDHPLLAAAKLRGVEKRFHIMNNLPFLQG